MSVHRGRFVQFVHGGVGQAEIDHRTQAIRKRPSDVPPWVDSDRLDARLIPDRLGDQRVERARRSQEGLARYLRLDRGAGRLRLGGAAHQGDEILAAMQIVEPDVEPRPGASRDDVARRVARSRRR